MLERVWMFLIWNQAIKITIGDSFILDVETYIIQNDLKQFWRSTGFCPPFPHESAYDFTYGRDMEHNLALIGSVPHGGIEQVRIHWLLDLVTIDTIKDNKLVYNYTKLDNIIKFLVKRDMKPGFELMGSPSRIFNDFENKTQVYLWRDFIKAMAQHFIDRFGVDEVVTWNFETWNEPDCGDFEKVKMTVQGFLNYYDACSEGLREANPFIRFGGPGAGCDRPGHSSYVDGLLEHVVNGTNYFTGERGVRIDFLSFHRKGNGSSQKIIDEEIEVANKIKKLYPVLAKKPFYNDEADPLVGWSKEEEWRADATYAAMVAKVIAQHQNMIISKSDSPIYNYSLLSNDNGFLSWYPYQFTQRTLTARFQMNNTNPPHVQFVRKPVHSVMRLLSLLGDQQVQATLTRKTGGDKFVVVQNDSYIGVIGSVHYQDHLDTPDFWQSSILIYQSLDTQVDPEVVNSIELNILLTPPYPNGSVVMAVGYSVKNDYGDMKNPYALWKGYGSPKFPSVSQFKCMRNAEGPFRTFNTSFSTFNHPAKVMLNITIPEVVLVHFCARSFVRPNQVDNVTVYNVTSGQVLVTWSDDSVNTKCIWTYEVEFQHQNTTEFTKINDYDIIVTSFYFTPGQGVDELDFGAYRVRAVDYWGRYGDYSPPVKYPVMHDQ